MIAGLKMSWGPKRGTRCGDLSPQAGIRLASLIIDLDLLAAA